MPPPPSTHLQHLVLCLGLIFHLKINMKHMDVQPGSFGGRVSHHYWHHYTLESLV
jgi:hypothetical protein